RLLGARRKISSFGRSAKVRHGGAHRRRRRRGFPRLPLLLPERDPRNANPKIGQRAIAAAAAPPEAGAGYFGAAAQILASPVSQESAATPFLRPVNAASNRKKAE